MSSLFHIGPQYATHLLTPAARCKKRFSSRLTSRRAVAIMKVHSIRIAKGVGQMINYAHRGASEYAPENTLSSFYLGLIQGANGIETDVQRTRDGVPVLFHDDTIDRVSDGHGKISDYTFDQLKKVKIYGNCTTGFYDQIVS